MSQAGFTDGPGAAGPAVHIDRLVLRVAGLDERGARTLARLVAEGLEPGLFSIADHGGLGHLRIEVTAGPADQGRPDLLARRITRELGRNLGPGRDGGAVR
jgi:hypothetical protein